MPKNPAITARAIRSSNRSHRFTTTVVATGTRARVRSTQARTAISPRRNGVSSRLRPAKYPMYASRMGMRVPARRSRKIQRRLRTVTLTRVSRQAPTRDAQNAGRIGPNDPVKLPRIRTVAMRPTTRMAAAEAASSTQAIARGDRAPVVDSGTAATEAGGVARSDHTAPWPW
jgi:hypothetical protein